jgi:chromosome segregation ATPase
MKKNIRINNIPFENVIVSEEGSNIIYAKSCKEEFFGVYNINLGEKSILCESNSPTKVYCEVVLNNKVYENIPFEVVKSNNPKIIINKNKIDQNMISEETLMQEILGLKKELREVSKKNSLINESVKENYKEELLQEFFHVANQNENFIENKIQVLEEELQENIKEYLGDNIVKAVDIFKNENSKSMQSLVNEFYSEISDANKNDFEGLKESFKEEISNIEEKYKNDLNKNILSFSEENKKVLEELQNSRKGSVEILSESIEKAKKEIEKEYNSKISSISKKALSSLSESFENYKKEIQKNLEEKISISEKSSFETLSESIQKTKNDLLFSFEESKKDFNEKFLSKFESILKQKEKEIQNSSEEIFESHKNNLDSIFEIKMKEVEESSREILEESKKKIKDLEKRVDDLSGQLNKSNSEKKRIENLLQESRSYTDKKMTQMLEESKRFTRVMMDFVGGGSGSVAVQYAAGGKIEGDLDVSGNLSAGSTSITLSGGDIQGDLNVSGNLTATNILSGDKDLTKMFAGEGEGDDNPLDGGFI